MKVFETVLFVMLRPTEHPGSPNEVDLVLVVFEEDAEELVSREVHAEHIIET